MEKTNDGVELLAERIVELERKMYALTGVIDATVAIDALRPDEPQPAAAPQPASDAIGEIEELREQVNHYRVKAEAYGGMVRGCNPALERAGHPVDGRGPDGAVGGIARAVEALVREREDAKADVERLKAELEAGIRAIRELRAKLEEQQPPAAPQPAPVSDAQAAMDQGRAVVQRQCAAEQAADAFRAAPHFSRSSMMTEEASLDELQMLVHYWADERKILSDSSPQAQLVKLTEEVGELAAGVCRDDQQKIIDSIGDTAVVLIVMCGILRVSFRRCLQAAYDEIKGRSGTIEGGVFVKTSDAAPQPAAPPAGWLTDEEREHLGLAAHFLRRYGLSIGAQTIEGILSRAGSPPVVEVPAMNGVTAARVEARAYRAAMDKAGVKWKEVWRE